MYKAPLINQWSFRSSDYIFFKIPKYLGIFHSKIEKNSNLTPKDVVILYVVDICLENLP
jgi:hypothetical protein